MKAADYEALVARDMREAVLLQRCRELARLLGVLTYHTHDSRRSEAGYPDLHLLGAGVDAYRELKTQRGRITSDQHTYLDRLAACGHDVAVWRPADLLDGRIEREIRALAQGRAAA